MKSYRLKRTVIGLLLIVGTLAWADDEEYRIFKDADGREVTAGILEYDAIGGKVKLKIKGARKGWVPLSSLSSEDQTYVVKWYGEARFLSDDLLEISITDKVSGWERGIGPLVDERRSRFVINLSNHGDTDLDNIRVVCCEIRNKDGATAYSHYNLKTTKVCAGDQVEEEKALFSRRNKTRKTINSVIGVRIRLYWTSPDGNELMREISMPKQLSDEKYPWQEPAKKQDDSLTQGAAPEQATGSISNVSTKEKRHSTKKREAYNVQTFEYTYSISPCTSYRVKSFFEFKDRSSKITFMSSQSYHSKGPDKQVTSISVLNIDAEKHGLENVELNAYWIQIYAIDASGESHLVTEAHDGCTSLEELKERNDPPIGV